MTDSPRFTSLPHRFGRLAFLLDGAVLVHVWNNETALWNTQGRSLIGFAEGEFAGAAHDEQTIVTRIADWKRMRIDEENLQGGFRRAELARTPFDPPTFRCWNTRTAAACLLQDQTPNGYGEAVRFSISADRNAAVLKIEDIFDRMPARTMHFPRLHGIVIENWMVLPGEQRLVMVVYGSGGGFETTFGQAVEFSDGQLRYRFPAGSTDYFKPHLYHSASHHLLVVPALDHPGMALYDSANGGVIARFDLPRACLRPAPRIPDTWVAPAALNPQNRHQAALAFRGVHVALMRWESGRTEAICEGVITTNALIEDVVFHSRLPLLATAHENGDLRLWSLQSLLQPRQAALLRRPAR